MNHLYDDEIQMILDGDQIQTRLAHAEECDECSKKLEAYRLIFRELSHLEPEMIAADFTDHVMAGLPEFEKEHVWMTFEKLCFIFTALISAFSFFYWIDWKKLFKAAYGWTSSLKLFSQQIRYDLSFFNVSLPETVLWFGAGLSVLVLLMCLDKLLSPKHDPVSFHS